MHRNPKQPKNFMSFLSQLVREQRLIGYSYVNLVIRKHSNINENAVKNTCQADFLTSDKNSNLYGSAASPRSILARFSRNHCAIIAAASCSTKARMSRVAIFDKLALRLRADSSKSCSALSEQSNRNSSGGRGTGFLQWAEAEFDAKGTWKLLHAESPARCSYSVPVLTVSH